MKDAGFTGIRIDTPDSRLSPDEAAFAAGEPCPLCAKHTDPVTGERHLNAETIAAIEEGDAMVRGDIPSPTFNTLAELLAELRS
jgi:hypothetical protein